LLEIQIIFMEWGCLARESSLNKYTKEMLDFMKKLNYTPLTLDYERLKLSNWKTWPWDIMWKKY